MSDTPDLSSFPELPGFASRHFAGRDDVPGMLAVHDANRERDRIDPDSVCYRLPSLSPDRYAAWAVGGITLRPLLPVTHRQVARALSEANLNPPGHESRWTGTALQQRLDLEEAEWLGRVIESDPLLSVVAWADAVMD